jgi:hypothetical protein
MKPKYYWLVGAALGLFIMLVLTGGVALTGYLYGDQMNSLDGGLSILFALIYGYIILPIVGAILGYLYGKLKNKGKAV